MACDAGNANTEWASYCPPQNSCLNADWNAPRDGSETGAPLRLESAHFAFYWNDDTNITLADAQQAADTLEMIWDNYFGDTIDFPEPYCNSTTKWKAAVHFDNDFPLWGGGWWRNGIHYAGMWVGPGAANDSWGLAHEFMHGVQSLTPAFPECGGSGCGIYESHANWMPHQIFRNNVHCSEMLVNSPHLHYGNTRNRYCNWQVFEYLKDRYCASTVNNMWTAEALTGQGDPWQKLMHNQNWDIDQLNDFFGEWAMHNVTWDYRDPDGNDQGAVYRQNYGLVTNTNYSQRRLRLTQLEALSSNWQSTRRFSSPYYQAPQRWGYNVIRLHAETNASQVSVNFRGVMQSNANSGWRWGLVATDSNNVPRYSQLQSGAEGSLTFCINSDEQLFLVVLAAPTQYQKITWQQPMDGTPYPSIYRYPYLLEITGAWPQGFKDGERDSCPANTARHENGGGCATSNTPASVYVGPYAMVKGGTVNGNARIEDQAMILNGTVSGGTVGALTTLGVVGNPHHGAATFNVSGSATLRATFYPMGWFANGAGISGTASYLGDLEVYASNKSNNTFYGLVDDATQGVSDAPDHTLAPPYSWRD
ncbi:hypothetical protein P886_0754 [Alteromonadaceae bacterium 2753L.S.0a.02]|nr:hypothetical protein P886_0754 [Alteromonadaceae bacterium 2753L.S.0a.02]